MRSLPAERVWRFHEVFRGLGFPLQVLTGGQGATGIYCCEEAAEEAGGSGVLAERRLVAADGTESVCSQRPVLGSKPHPSLGRPVTLDRLLCLCFSFPICEMGVIIIVISRCY